MREQRYPVCSVDYPGTFQEFDNWFSTEEDCLAYIAKLRWPQGFNCPSCGVFEENPSTMGRGLFLCRKCKRQTSVTAGTLFHKTHKPLRTWFLAIWFVTSQKNGASALGLKRVLGLGSCDTAWTWMHKLRRAMVRPDRGHLTGAAEVDETYVGGVGEKIRGRGSERKVIVAIAASGDPAHVIMPRVHRVASLLFDRWWLGTHQGAIRPVQLAYYLDEFTFRFNRRNSKARGLLFYRLMECAPVPRPKIIGG